jgi:pyruvate formate lyase activating enzyme
MNGTIFNIKRFAVHDGPGIRTTIFLKGCPLRCCWCHNPESWSGSVQSFNRKTLMDGHEFCETEQIGRQISVDGLLQELEKERIVMEESGGGVTFSGGEPLMQPLFLKESLKACFNTGIHTALDTSGYATKKIIEEIVPYTNLFLWDLKLMDDDKHIFYTGVSNRQIISNLKWLSQLGKEIFIRIPVITGITSTDENLFQIIRFLDEIRNSVSRIDILPYHRIGKSKYEKLNISFQLKSGEYSPDSSQLERILSLFRKEGYNVHSG